MANQTYSNLASSTLASAYTAGDSTITVSSGDGAKFPSSGDFIIGFNDPPTFFLKCTSRSSDVLTVSTTGQEGTTAANVASGDTVAQVITAGAFDNIRINISGIGAIASLPASGMKSGDQYQCTDCPINYVYDGSNWKAFAFGQPVTLPTGSTFGSTDSVGTSTTSSASGGMIFTGAGITDVGMWYKTAPSNSATFAYSQTPESFDIANSGIGFRESATGKIISIAPSIQSGTYSFEVSKRNSASSFNSSALRKSYQGMFMPGPMYWQRLRFDSTKIYVDVSGDSGITWSNIYNQNKNTFFTTAPNQVGVVLPSSESLHLWHYSET